MAGVKRREHVAFVRMENERQELSEQQQVLAGTWAAFGENVRRLRKARGWTQGYLAERLSMFGVDMHQTTVAKIEGGTRPTVVHEIWTLAYVFKVGLDVLFPPIAQEVESDGEQARLIRRRNELRVDLAEANNEAARITEKQAALERELQECEDRLDALAIREELDAETDAFIAQGDRDEARRTANRVASREGARHGQHQEAP